MEAARCPWGRVLLGVLMLSACGGADIKGRWKSTEAIEGYPVILEISDDDPTLTGTVTVEDDVLPITTGSRSGDELRLEFVIPEESKVVFELSIKNDRLPGTYHSETIPGGKPLVDQTPHPITFARE
jgi:hypothetical protein